MMLFFSYTNIVGFTVIVLFSILLCLMIFWPVYARKHLCKKNGVPLPRYKPPPPPSRSLYNFKMPRRGENKGSDVELVGTGIHNQQVNKEFHGRFRVVDGKLDFDCTTRNISFEEVRENIIKLRDELNRQIANEHNCPHYTHANQDGATIAMSST